MKTTNNQLKGVLFLIVFIFSLNTYTQDDSNTKKEFIRVFNLEGKKIAKGRIVFISDSILGISKKGIEKSINIENIGIIKTKRSAGNNILVGSLIGATTCGIIGVKTADPSALLGYNKDEGFIIGAVLGGTAGAAIGGLTILGKNSITYIIDGNPEKLNQFKNSIS